MKPRSKNALLAALVSMALGACASPGAAPLATAPFVLVLGTAQDGGLPQIACEGELCRRARAEPGFARHVSSLLVVDPRQGKRWLIDATPDLPEQLLLADAAAPRSAQGGRPALFDGIFLTHAHVGHYTGLLHLGREVYGSQATPVHASRRMSEFLTDNGPWSLLVEAQHLELQPIEPEQWVDLAEDLRVRAFVVPHRDEFSDTLGFEVQGPSARLLFIPDIDKWGVDSVPIEERLARVDHALLDGSFFAEGEIPGRAMAEIPHPFITETLERLAPLPASERAKVIFTHLNHTNPASDPGSAASARIRASGMRVAWDGLRLDI